MPPSAAIALRVVAFRTSIWMTASTAVPFPMLGPSRPRPTIRAPWLEGRSERETGGASAFPSLMRPPSSMERWILLLGSPSTWSGSGRPMQGAGCDGRLPTTLLRNGSVGLRAECSLTPSDFHSSSPDFPGARAFRRQSNASHALAAGLATANRDVDSPSRESRQPGIWCRPWIRAAPPTPDFHRSVPMADWNGRRTRAPGVGASYRTGLGLCRRGL